MIFESLSMLPLVKDKVVWTKSISGSINKSKSPPISSLFSGVHRHARRVQDFGSQSFPEDVFASQHGLCGQEGHLPPLWADHQGVSLGQLQKPIMAVMRRNYLQKTICKVLFAGTRRRRWALPVWRSVLIGWHQHGEKYCFSWLFFLFFFFANSCQLNAS